ncbi:uncharacterized protein LOC113342496 [Papaver somniferum]|uniref:uncharacterized protein LOC113342496 n=1 Tax=Papaver somniferum TaxID=3469 RepID=UPI000E704DED|nr:uncharacterized protein LOC113342496 [Papaver somniferum]
MNTFKAPSPFPTNEEIKSFHAIDRGLYKRLVIDLGQDMILSMKAISFWMWLEEVGFPNNIVSRLLKIGDTELSLIFGEAVGCLKCIESSTLPFSSPTANNVIEIPLTKALVSPMGINVTRVYQNRDSARIRINHTVNQVFSVAFDDIIQQAVRNNRQHNLSPSVPSAATHHVSNGNQTSIWMEGLYLI